LPILKLIRLNKKTASLLTLFQVVGLVWPTLFLIVILSIISFISHPLLWVVSLLSFGFFLKRLVCNLFVPLVSMQNALYDLNQGVPGVRMGYGGVLDSMTKDIDSLIEELADLYNDMDSRVGRQTRRLAEKTASLKIPYDAANSINQARSLDELLVRFLQMLKVMVNGRSATVRILSATGEMRIVACIGIDGEVVRAHEILPVYLCPCGVSLTPGDILCERDPAVCSSVHGRPMYGPDEIEVIEVPMPYHEELMGSYHIYAPRVGPSAKEEERSLLKAIGRHLGVAVAKHRSDIEARRFMMVQERTALAHELHDSLAQTLASLRFQVRMLSETLEQEDTCLQAKGEIQRIVGSVDEANDELRALLTSFRVPDIDKGLVSALEQLSVHFRKQTGLVMLLQIKCHRLDLTASEEVQLLRIVQECLANIRKHARAHTVRILLRCSMQGGYSLLVEDDGVGFEYQGSREQAGEHIGLAILQERAQRLGGQVRIESEPGDGTRVELNFIPKRILLDATE
jgi:two-component system nitrate/nitrite sensor histidine kinase NarX